jgi:hypothetical protein
VPDERLIGWVGEARRRAREPSPLREVVVQSVDADGAWVLVSGDPTPRGPCVWAAELTGPSPGDTAWAQVADTGRWVLLAWAAA